MRYNTCSPARSLFTQCLQREESAGIRDLIGNNFAINNRASVHRCHVSYSEKSILHDHTEVFFKFFITSLRLLKQVNVRSFNWSCIWCRAASSIQEPAPYSCNMDHLILDHLNDPDRYWQCPPADLFLGPGSRMGHSSSLLRSCDAALCIGSRIFTVNQSAAEEILQGPNCSWQLWVHLNCRDSFH